MSVPDRDEELTDSIARMNATLRRLEDALGRVLKSTTELNQYMAATLDEFRKRVEDMKKPWWRR